LRCGHGAALHIRWRRTGVRRDAAADRNLTSGFYLHDRDGAVGGAAETITTDGDPLKNSARRLSAACTAGLLSALVLTAGFGGGAAEAATLSAPIPPSGTHTVQAGDTLSGIASRYGVSLGAVFAANNMGMNTIIYPGQAISLSAGAAAAAAASPAPANPADKIQPMTAGDVKDTFHTVKPGDTLGHIAGQYGVTLSSVFSLNGMNGGTIIYPGQRIVITRAYGSSPAEPVQAPAPAGNLSSAQIKALVADTAQRMGVDPSLALAIAMQESGFRQDVTSSAGAIGTMQIMPASGEWASQLAGRQLDLYNAADNITGGVAIIRTLVNTSPSLEVAIASYYQGQYSVMTRGMYEDTKAYVASVLRYQQTFR
jgi:N-acetylmuramoyl-L-alanine amidase